MSGLFAFLIIGVGFTSLLFSKKYLQFHKNQNRFLLSLAVLLIAALIIAVAENVLWILGSWLAVALLLPSLIGFDGAKQSRLAERFIRSYLLFGSILLCFGFLTLLSYVDGYDLSQVNQTISEPHSYTSGAAFASIVIACLVQSSVFPFHKWLLSSMCAPTPASALMHAGLVSSGGILLIRLHPILAESFSLSLVIFIMGCLNAYLGNMWMRVRPDIKSSLGCSTISQMGFMLMQIGLGCYTSAILHIVLHGFYKSHHFLASPSVVNLRSNRSVLNRTIEAKMWFALSSAATFAIYILFAGKSLTHPDTGILVGILFSLVIGACVQKIGTLDDLSFVRRAVGSSVFALGVTTLYTSALGFSANLLQIDAPIPLTISHAFFFGVFLLAWHISAGGRVQASHRLHLLCLNAGAPYSNKRLYQGV